MLPSEIAIANGNWLASFVYQLTAKNTDAHLNTVATTARDYMRLTVSNCRDLYKRELIKDCSQFFAEYLMGTRLSKAIDVNIKLRNLKPTEYAYTDWLDTNVLPRSFEVELNQNIKSRAKLIKVIAHEFVHIKQFAKGELVDHVKRASSRYLGQVYPNDYDTPDSLLPWSSPWEIEAYGREQELFYAYRDHLRALKKDAKDLAKKRR